MPVSRLGPPSPLPRFRWQQPIPDTNPPPPSGLSQAELEGAFDWGKDSILPYAVHDDYDRSQAAGIMPLIELQNSWLKIAVAPHLGGRLMQLYDKRLGRELVFRNPVFQPANLAVLNAWFSGGIEWNGLIPGHTPSTTAPVFCGVVETERGPVLRIYEFDRIVAATWQIDLFLPEGDDRLFVHGRIVNTAPSPKQAYWWTNVAVPTAPGMRVISPADYSIEHVLPSNELARFAFPDPERFDGSYPANWHHMAPSVFFRKPDAARKYIAALDQKGAGLAQVSTTTLQGRKFFYFGTSRGGQHWMDHLARKGEGDYVEIQSGIQPTQNQRFELPASSEVHWTEVYGALEVDPAAVHAADYQAAEHQTGLAVDTRFPQAELADVDAFLTAVSSLPAGHLMSEGSPWGARQERLTGRALATGLDFSTSDPKDFWDAIALGDPPGPEDLDKLPGGFAVSATWVSALQRNRSAHGGSWLHDLMLGIAALDRGDRAEAWQLTNASLDARPSWLGLRQRALLADGDYAAVQDYLAAWAENGAPLDLAIEIVGFLLRKGREAALDRFLSSLPDQVAAHERIALARAVIASRRGEWDGVEAILNTRFATIREGETLPSDLWNALQIGRLTQALARTPTSEEAAAQLAAFPVPEHLDFRMLTNLEPHDVNR